MLKTSWRLALASSVCVLAVASNAAQQPARAPQHATSRAADLVVFKEQFLARDKSYSTEARAEAERRLTALAGQVATVSQPAFELELARIAALADNGHTHYVLGSIQRHYNRVPLRLAAFGGQFYVLRAQRTVSDLLGARLESIDGHAVIELRDAARALWGGVPAFRDQFAFNLLESPALLHAASLAVDDDAATYRFVAADGKAIERRMAGEPPSPQRPFAQPERIMLPEPIQLEDASWVTALTLAKAPWSLQHWNERFRWRQAPEVDGLVIEFRQNLDSPDARIAPALQAFERAIASAKPVNLVVDMRMNGGGNLNLTRDFMQSLPTRVPGRIFVLTSPRTFSAAISSVGYLKQSAPDRVSIVGEAVGDRLVFFAEGRGVDLPSSLGMIGMSTERHDYQNGCRRFTDCHRSVVSHPIAVPSLEPDLKAPWTIETYLAGVDPALEVITQFLRKS